MIQICESRSKDFCFGEKKFMSKFSKSANFLFGCLLAIFCFYQATDAQSGRRSNKTGGSINKNGGATQQAPPVETKPAETEKEAPMGETPRRIASMTVVGEVQHNFTYNKSNYIDVALKECIDALQTSKILTLMTRGSGKMTYAEAKETAEKESDTYILWLGFALQMTGSGNGYIESVQYALLSPQTGKVVTRGEIEAKPNQTLATGGVINLPNGRQRTDELIQMKDGARQVAAILMRGGWLK